ncbi:MAG: tRNA pseudouridine(55) synthase TruB [Deltaproteobacteria bacterium]|nr:tRNA pseudouridine(55) synthase TruB [Deltaproteobacteria bacterium]
MMDGVVVIDKPAGKTSHDVVSEVKKILGVRKAGHTGTLDPMATGVLPVCLNEATKLAGFLTGEDKEYLATMLLGVKTDTLDIEGKIISQSDVLLTEEEIRAAIMRMAGKIKQIPPAYSAVKYCGKPLYKWARNGVLLDVKPREVIIHGIVIEDISSPHVTFRVVCSKGTYIRTLCCDIGDLLGVGACLSGLRRLRSGFFSEEMAVSLNNYNDNDKKNKLLEKILPMANLLPLLATIELKDRSAEKLRNGWQPSVEMLKEHDLPLLKAGDMVKFISKGYLLAVAEMLAPVTRLSEFDGKMQAARIVRVFNNISK